MAAIRLDSGDFNALSHQSRQLLDQAGFTTTKIVASGDLDEHIIAELKQQGAPIDIWGVGTRLTVGWDQPALDIAYKLTAICDEHGVWQNKLKLSNQPSKSTNPGIQQVRRFSKKERWVGDVIYDLNLGISNYVITESDQQKDLLKPIFKQGELVYKIPSIEEIRNHCRKNVTDFQNSGLLEYPVMMEPRLKAVKDNLFNEIRRGIDDEKNRN